MDASASSFSAEESEILSGSAQRDVVVATAQETNVREVTPLPWSINPLTISAYPQTTRSKDSSSQETEEEEELRAEILSWEEEEEETSRSPDRRRRPMTKEEEDEERRRKEEESRTAPPMHEIPPFSSGDPQSGGRSSKGSPDQTATSGGSWSTVRDAIGDFVPPEEADDGNHFFLMSLDRDFFAQFGFYSFITLSLVFLIVALVFLSWCISRMCHHCGRARRFQNIESRIEREALEAFHNSMYSPPPHSHHQHHHHHRSNMTLDTDDGGSANCSIVGGSVFYTRGASALPTVSEGDVQRETAFNNSRPTTTQPSLTQPPPPSPPPPSSTLATTAHPSLAATQPPPTSQSQPPPPPPPPPPPLASGNSSFVNQSFVEDSAAAFNKATFNNTNSSSFANSNISSLARPLLVPNDAAGNISLSSSSSNNSASGGGDVSPDQGAVKKKISSRKKRSVFSNQQKRSWDKSQALSDLELQPVMESRMKEEARKKRSLF